MLQNDARAIAEIEAMKRAIDAADFFRRTGGSINQQLVAPKLRWIERHEPKLFARIATVFGSYDYITSGNPLDGPRSKNPARFLFFPVVNYT